MNSTNNKGTIGYADGVMGINCSVNCFNLMIIIPTNNKGGNMIC